MIARRALTNDVRIPKFRYAKRVEHAVGANGGGRDEHGYQFMLVNQVTQ